MKKLNTVEPRNSAKFGHPDFVRYCGVLRYLAGSLFQPKNHTLQIYSIYVYFQGFFSLLASKTRAHITSKIIGMFDEEILILSLKPILYSLIVYPLSLGICRMHIFSWVSKKCAVLQIFS